MTAPVCLISGVGPDTGSALAMRFTEGGFCVALLARSEAHLGALEKELANAKGYQSDVSDPAQIESVAFAVERELGNPSVVIHNAVGGSFGTFREIEPSVLNRNFLVNTMGLLCMARRFSPAMISAGKGAIAVTGNTSALRGKPGFAGFAPTKAAQRILAEAMARELGFARGACRLRRHRRGNRLGEDQEAVQGPFRRIFHQSSINRARDLAHRSPGSQCVVVQCRAVAVRRSLAS